MPEKKEKVTSASVNILISVNQMIFVSGPELHPDLRTFIMPG
jgi:hypothetical protein